MLEHPSFPLEISGNPPRQYPVKFGLQITRMYHRLCHTACGKPEAHKGRRWEPVDVLFNEKHWADFWDDAEMLSVLRYLRGNTSLKLPEPWKTLLSQPI